MKLYQCSLYSHSVHSIQRISTSTPNQPLFSRSTHRFFFIKSAFQISLISILFILLGFCITDLHCHWNYHWNYHSTLTLCNCTTRFDLNSINGHYRSTYGQNYDIVTGTRNSSNPRTRICKYRYGRQRPSFDQLRVFNYRGLFDKVALSETPSSWFKANGTQNGLPHGLIQSLPKEELGAFVIQLDTAHWQHELQILSAMSTNKDLKVSASVTLNGKKIIRPLDATTHLWLQSCTCISQKSVKFIQLIKKSVVTAVMQMFIFSFLWKHCLWISVSTQQDGYCHTTHQRKTWNQQGQYKLF